MKLAGTILYGASVADPLAWQQWGQLVGYVRDDSGFLVDICSPVAG